MFSAWRIACQAGTPGTGVLVGPQSGQRLFLFHSLTSAGVQRELVHVVILENVRHSICMYMYMYVYVHVKGSRYINPLGNNICTNRYMYKYSHEYIYTGSHMHIHLRQTSLEEYLKV